MSAPGNEHLCSPVVLPGWFTAAECARWRAACEECPPRPAGLVVPREGYREGRVAWLAPQAAGADLRDKLWQAVTLANRWYGFALDGFEDFLQYASYGPGHHAEWHADCGMGGTASRKLSLSLQLTPPQGYEGGCLEFLPGGRPQLARNLGCVIAFPSFLTHRVTPVESGHRGSLVAWVHGPAFR